MNLGALRYKWEAARRDAKDPEIRYETIGDLRTEAKQRGWLYADVLPAGIQECRGSLGLSEDFALWIERGNQLLETHRDTPRDRRLAERWAAFLHSVRRYPVSEVYTCLVPRAKVISRGGGVLTERDELVPGGHFILWPPRRSELPAAPPAVHPGRYVSLVTVWGDTNFSHFVLDALLRVTLLGELADYRFLVPENLKPWHRGFLEVLGISEDRIVRTDNLFTQVEELMVCRTAAEGIIPRLELLLKFRETVLQKVSPVPAAKKRIFIDRSGSQRKLANQAELEPLLRERGFEIHRLEDLSVREQIRLFAGAEIVAGLHGSGFLNTIFAPPGTKLLEIYNPVWWDTSILRYTSLLGHEHWHCFGENVSRDFDTKVDARKLARALDYLLDAPVTDPPPA